ncbi:MAG: MmcQ/YjbR family DNA-binding protein [Terracidiphilus sp.]
MISADFRRIALSFEGAEEGSHMGQVDFRVGGRIFATLASEKQGFGNLMLTPEMQATFVAEQPELFVPIAGGWGKNGATHVRLAEANEDLLSGALRTAWQLRIEKNQKSRSKPGGSARQRDGVASDPEAAKRRKAELRARLISPMALESVKKRYGLDD